MGVLVTTHINRGLIITHSAHEPPSRVCSLRDWFYKVPYYGFGGVPVNRRRGLQLAPASRYLSNRGKASGITRKP